MKKNLKWIIVGIVVVALGIFGYIQYVQKYKLTEVTSSSYNEYKTTVYMVGEPVMPYGPTKCRAKIYKDNKQINSYDFSLYNDGAKVFDEDFSFEWHDNFVRIIADVSEMDGNDGVFDFYYVVD